jgi:hypothetical protein
MGHPIGQRRPVGDLALDGLSRRARGGHPAPQAIPAIGSRVGRPRSSSSRSPRRPGSSQQTFGGSPVVVLVFLLEGVRADLGALGVNRHDRRGCTVVTSSGGRASPSGELSTHVYPTRARGPEALQSPDPRPPAASGPAEPCVGPGGHPERLSCHRPDSSLIIFGECDQPMDSTVILVAPSDCRSTVVPHLVGGRART